MEELLTLRTQIDQIDHQIIEIIAKRFEVTKQVGMLKKQHNIDSVDPSREAEQFKRFETISHELGLNPDMVSSIFKLIISNVVKKHNDIKQQHI